MKKTILIASCLFSMLFTNAQHQTIGLNYSIGFNPSGDKFTYDNKEIGNYSLGWYVVPGSAEARLSGYGGINFFTNRTPRLTISKNGNIGIGTTITNNAILTINGDSYNTMRLENDTPNKEASLRFRSKSNSGGTLHSDISLYATGSNQGYLGFKVPHNNAVNNGYDMIINHSGNVGIGTINPESWRLAVNGKIRAKEIKVETGWSDFVFYDNYQLPTLQEVENHIKENGHLKDIPSAKEVEKNGIFLGEMDSKLLQKIEELTLYIIQQEKKIKNLEKENKELKSLSDRLTEIEKLLKSKK